MSERPNEAGQNGREETTGGNYFVSNYPPYSLWTPEHVSEAHAALDQPAAPGTALGVYLHIPFCRKRCHFCYFKVYTGKDSSEVERYLDAAIQELTLYSQKAFHQRPQAQVHLFRRRHAFLHLLQATDAAGRGDDEAAALGCGEEITFECEPGTLTESKLSVIKATRRDAAEPGRREFRPGDSRDQRPGARRQGDRHALTISRARSAFRRSTST